MVYHMRLSWQDRPRAWHETLTLLMVLQRQLLLVGHVAHRLSIWHSSGHALSSHLSRHSHSSAWMLTTHAAGLHTHHCASLMRCAGYARVHLHRLAHVLARIRGHAWMAVRHARMYTGRWLVCCHHLAILPNRAQYVLRSPWRCRTTATRYMMAQSHGCAAGLRGVEQQFQSGMDNA